MDTTTLANGPKIPHNQNQLRLDDRAVHDWYRLVQSFPPHLVRSYADQFGIDERHVVMDPFCGAGTTLVECKKNGIASIGMDPHPMAYFASSVKVDWSVECEALVDYSVCVTEAANEALYSPGYDSDGNANEFIRTPSAFDGFLEPDETKLLIKNSLSPNPAYKTLLLLQEIDRHGDERLRRYGRLALADALVNGISNLKFGPEVGVGQIKDDAPVVDYWHERMNRMAHDVALLRDRSRVAAVLHKSDARYMDYVIKPLSVDAVITSPPYPNEKDYTRTTRLETVVLGLIKNRQELRQVKKHLLRSNTRGVYKSDTDDQAVAHYEGINDIASDIERRRIELGKTSGFERLYARVTKLYFGGMLKHLASLRPALRPGAKLAYVVGDQASFLRILIPTSQILADIAQGLGYRVTSIDLFRTRFSTATGQYLKEEVVVMEWQPSYLVNLGGIEMSGANTYEQILEKVFLDKYTPGSQQVDFVRADLTSAAETLGLDQPLNLGDIPYSFRYRGLAPSAIMDTAPEGQTWIMRPAGRGVYRFALVTDAPIAPNPDMAVTKVPDATPGIVAAYSESDEQSLLARLRYNRLIDVFLGITCYSLQNHLRTTVDELGQVETDEIYVGIDKRGSHYVVPVQAKSERDQIGRVQLEQDIALCRQRWPELICRPVAAQMVDPDAIALFEFELQDDEVKIVSEKHYQLVDPEDVTTADLQQYRNRPSE